MHAVALKAKLDTGPTAMTTPHKFPACARKSCNTACLSRCETVLYDSLGCVRLRVLRDIHKLKRTSLRNLRRLSKRSNAHHPRTADRLWELPSDCYRLPFSIGDEWGSLLGQGCEPLCRPNPFRCQVPTVTWRHYLRARPEPVVLSPAKGSKSHFWP